MKNLFKNLMLVAVAAMAFTACQNDNNEVNEVNRVTRYEFTANIADDTRSGFVEKEEGATAYKSEWHEGDEVKVFIDNYGTVTTGIDTDGNFALELTDAPEPFYMTVCAPADSWTGKTSWTVPTEQTPLANSVDPKAHILRSNENILVSNGTPNEKIVMSHKAAYGKMTVKGVDFAIDHVVVDIKGTYFGYDYDMSYTINATYVENNEFWFAVEYAVEVSSLTVTAYDAEGNAVAKTVDMTGKEKPLAFSIGQVSTFSVKDLEVPAEPEPEPEAPKTLVFTSASWVNNKASDKLVQFYTEDGAILQLNWYNCGSDAWIVPNTYGFASSGAIYYGGSYSWYENSAFGIDAEISAGTVVVSVVDGKYYIEFTNLADWDGNVYIESATFTGLISGLQVPDMRTKLAAPSNITSSVDGKTITLSWGAVEGADGYRVKLDSPDEEYFDEIVTTTEYVYEAQLYSTEYSFTIMSYANDENVSYKSSDDAYANATTGKDPNKLADYELDSVTVNSNYFEFIRKWHNGSANTTTCLRIYMHNNDKGNNYINPGRYNCLGQGASTPSSAGSVNLRYCTDTWAYFYSTANSSSYLDVEIVDGQYVIIATIDGKTWGYKGLPTGWIIPEGGDSGEGGDEPVDPTPDPDPDPTPDPDPDPTPGEGETQSYEVTSGSTDWNWAQMTFTAGSKTLTGRLKYPKASQSPGEYTLVAGSSSTNYTFHTIAVDGVAATSVSGTISLQLNTTNGRFFDITFNDIVVDGMTFTGFARVTLP